MKRPRFTLRMRLTLLYGSLFFAAGLVLLGVTYVLVDHQTGGPDRIFSVRVGVAGGPGGAAPNPVLRTETGDLLTADQAGTSRASRSSCARQR
jgi:hypothetical protein